MLGHIRQDYVEHAEQNVTVNNVPGNVVVHNDVLNCDLQSENGAVGGNDENIYKIDRSFACIDKKDAKCNICEGSCKAKGNT